ncbi:MAG: transporter [Reyranella sp.]|uniref:SphA family protein n=1 Tax=Reyranella sp. TaxID=1929291 RepID=UPI00272FF7C3|nr:transporter [Reyranella sp.]MDP1966462.1 transporter [Reyranella sp.]MDP2372835.1 transporter [Reyranella sp.]
MSVSALEARADEGGSGFWLPGSFAAQAAVPVARGFTLETSYYHATATTHPTLNVTRGNNLISGLNATSDFLSATPTYALATPGLGGQLELSVTFLMGNYTAADPGMFSDSMTALGDLSPSATQKWTLGVHNFMAYAAANIPIGSYDRSRLATTGLGYWAVDGGVGYTYFDEARGQELSAVLGFTYSFMNPNTAYQTGIDLHLDLSASQYLNDNFYVGVAGYFYNQITGDSGSGAVLGAFLGRVAGVGPQVGYDFSLGGRDGTLSARAYYEFAAQNRPYGWNAWLTLSIALGAPAKKAAPAL